MFPSLCLKVADILELLAVPSEITTRDDGRPAVLVRTLDNAVAGHPAQLRIAIWDDEGQVLIDMIPCATITVGYLTAVEHFSVLFNRHPHHARMVVLSDPVERKNTPLLVTYRAVLVGVASDKPDSKSLLASLAQVGRSADLGTRALNLLAGGVIPDVAFDFVCAAPLQTAGVMAAAAGLSLH